ncbi:hypothetical protein [Pseudactinotalea sp.]|uniref:hypothetical protein n=1 Tax=Pseudactinotalea sp. TaxID=1926260 RepID=UPI003B3BA617
MGADGLIDPSQFACRASDLQPSREEMAGEELATLGDAVRWEITGIATDWAGLRPWYVAPEQESMLSLMTAPADDAREMQECLRTASNGLAAYAGDLVPIQRDLADLQTWEPLAVDFTTKPLYADAGRSGWDIPVGYRVWIAPEVGTFTDVADGLSACPFEGETLLSAPDDWYFLDVAEAMKATLDMNGLDEVPHQG